jgi:hypothetical protein
MNKAKLYTNKFIKWSRISFVTLQVFNGLSALAGGYGLIGDPTGKALQMDSSLLANSPFENFLIPGIVLFVVNGLGNAAGAIFSMLKKKHAPYIALLFGLILMVWITSQVAWIGYTSLLQPLYFITGVMQFIAALIFIREFKKSK